MRTKWCVLELFSPRRTQTVERCVCGEHEPSHAHNNTSLTSPMALTARHELYLIVLKDSASTESHTSRPGIQPAFNV